MLYVFALALLFDLSQLSALLVQEDGLEGTTCSKTSQFDETEREEDDEVLSLGSSCVQILQL